MVVSALIDGVDNKSIVNCFLKFGACQWLAQQRYCQCRLSNHSQQYPSGQISAGACVQLSY